MPDFADSTTQLGGGSLGGGEGTGMVLRARLHHQGPPGLNELCSLSPSGDHMPPPVEANWPWSQVQAQMLPGGLLEA